MTDTGKQQSMARSVRKRVLASRERIWRNEDFDGSADAIQAELRRLVKAGELEHVRRGVYWRGRRSRFGMTHASEGSALRKLLGKEAAIGAAGWYAANLLGLSTQVSPIEVLAVSVRPPAGFSQLRLVDRSGRRGRRDQRLNDLEVTFLEALEGWEDYVEEPPQRALTRFLGLLEQDEVRVSKLVRAAASEPAVVRERLRQVLRSAGNTIDADRVPGARSDKARRRALSVFPQEIAVAAA